MAVTRFSDSLEFLRNLCDALGIDHQSRLIQGVEIRAFVGEVVTVKIMELARADDDGNLVSMARKYTLHETQDEPEVSHVLGSEGD